MTLNGVMAAILRYCAEWVKICPKVSATKLYCKESILYETHGIMAIFAEVTKIERINDKHHLVKGHNLTATVRDRM